MVIARQEEFPAASNAVTVMLLLPTRSGTAADHVPVPAAVPPSPNPLAHFTPATPTLSVAVPLMVMVDADVEVIVVGGERIVNAGGTVSGPFDGGVGLGAGVGVGVGVGAGVGVGSVEGGCAGGVVLSP